MGKRIRRKARRGRVFFAAFGLAFGVGFGAGVATIQALFSPAGEPAVAAVRPTEPVGHLSEAAVAMPPPAPAAQFSGNQRLQAKPRLAAFVPTPAPDVIESLTQGAGLAPQARLGKAVLELPPTAIEQITVQRGDTLMDILMRAGIRPAEAHAAITALRQIYDPRRLRAGQELVITAAHEDAAADAPRQLLALAFELSFEHEIEVVRDQDGAFASAKRERPTHRQMVHRAGTINDSLYLAAQRSELPHDLIVELIKLFSWDVDFQRDIHPGNAFETLFEEISLASNAATVRSGDLLYARLTLSGRELEAYRFARADGGVDFYDRTGKSLRKFLLRTPVDGARLSSRFGPRRHPILGYNRMHKGIDFAAPTGTPIYAAGGGRVVAAARNGGYGNYIRIDHTGEYATAYAHLSRFAKGISRGRRVEQGQVIGFVGSTGASTGPHLHYEVLRNGTQINPLGIKYPPSTQLAGKDLEQFQQEMARIDRLRRQLGTETQVASKVDPRKMN